MTMLDRQVETKKTDDLMTSTEHQHLNLLDLINSSAGHAKKHDLTRHTSANVLGSHTAADASLGVKLAVGIPAAAAVVVIAGAWGYLQCLRNTAYWARAAEGAGDAAVIAHTDQLAATELTAQLAAHHGEQHLLPAADGMLTHIPVAQPLIEYTGTSGVTEVLNAAGEPSVNTTIIPVSPAINVEATSEDFVRGA